MEKTFPMIHGDLIAVKNGFVLARNWYNGLIYKAKKNESWIYRNHGKAICRLENAVIATINPNR